jgi:flagellar basal-body rod protein FlgG
MINALRSAATGMGAQQTRIDGIANDLANINTVGYKRSRAEFEDLYYDQIKTPGGQNSENIQSPNGIQLGHGTKLTSMSKVFTPGDVENTGQSLDVAIEGQGFLQFVDENGVTVYSRNGTLQVNKDGNIVNSNGLPLEPSVNIPANTSSISISKDGIISVKTPDSDQDQEIGRMEVAMFQNPTGLEYLGSNIYKPTEASGTATVATPGLEGSGKISQGFLESSNVNVGEALISMVVAQRSYESNSKVIETADRMMQAVNNIL